MSASTDKMICGFIRSRKPLERPYLSLRKVLEVEELPDGYLSIAADRFCDEELIDGESILLDFTDFPNLLLSSDGLLAGRDILKSYISQEELTQLFKILCGKEREVMLLNSMAQMLREMTVKDLLKYSKQAESEYRKFYLCELRQRLPWVKLAKSVRSAMHLFHIQVKYYRTIQILKTAAKSITARQENRIDE